MAPEESTPAKAVAEIGNRTVGWASATPAANIATSDASTSFAVIMPSGGTTPHTPLARSAEVTMNGCAMEVRTSRAAPLPGLLDVL